MRCGFRFKHLRVIWVFALLAGYLAQTFALHEHYSQHGAELLAARQSAPVSLVARDCQICDTAQLAPEPSSVTVTPAVAPVVQRRGEAEISVRQAGADLLAFGARAPPLV